MARRMVWVILVTAACATVFPARAGVPAFEQAMDDYTHARYVRAEGGFRAAAESGDLRAQEILGFMYAFGPNLYPGIPQNRLEAARWLDRAARGGSDSARYMFCAITRHPVRHRLGSAPCAIGRK